MTIYTVQVAAFEPAQDSHGRTDAWGDTVEVEVHGWAPISADDQPVEGSRRPVMADRQLFPIAAAGGPRYRWTFEDGVWEQIGHAGDYSHGPWWPDGDALVVYLKRVEG